MNRIFFRAASLALMCGASAFAQAPKTAPAPAPVKPAVIPPFQEATLPNGLRILLVESKRQPVVSLALMLHAGDSYDPSGKEGIATLVANTITKGAAGRSADDVSSAIESVGGNLSAATDADFLTVRANVLAPDAPLAFELVGDAISRAAFDSKEVELSRTQLLSALQLELSQPASLASRFFAAQIYGAHPYGRRSSTTSVRSITLDDLRGFQKSRLVPSGALLVVAGDVSLARAKELAAERMGKWSGSMPVIAKRPALPVRTKTEIVLVHRPGSVQSNIVVGNLTYPPASNSYYPLSVANRVIGGGADSRLFKVLREQKSWTYGAYSSVQRDRDIGNFQATAEVRNVVTDSALAELLSIVRTIGTTPVPVAELDAAKNGLVGSMPLRLETAQSIAEQVGRYTMLGLPGDYIRTLRPRLAAVTAAEVQRAAKAYMRSSQELIVVVGDGTQIYEKLAKIAPTRIVSTQGDAMTLADLTPRATALPVDISLLKDQADSFSVLVQGQAFGYQTTRLHKTADGFVLDELSSLGPIGQQSAQISFGADLAPRKLAAGGKLQGQDLKIDVTFANGRAKGSRTVPSPTGSQTAPIDTVIAPGTLDDNMIVALLPALNWSKTAKYTTLAFDASTGGTRTLTISVGGVESVTVPAGTFEVYRVDITGGAQTRTAMVTTAAPHRVVKTAIVGVPLEIVLVK